MLPLCFAAAFLLPATQINPATNRKITAQNYCPPCQLGKLPSSRISTDILALRAQNLQQLGASPDQKPQSRTLYSFLPASQQSTENTTGSQPIPQCTANTTVHRNSAHGKCNGSRPIQLAQQYSPQHPSPAEWCAHPPLPVPYSSLPTHTITPQPPPVLRPTSPFNILSSRDFWAILLCIRHPLGIRNSYYIFSF
jgi:hypothetical protein